MGSGLVLASAVPALAAHQACDDPSHLCIVSGDEGARWEAGEKSTSKNRSRRSTKQGGKLSVELEGGRASLFVNGRFRGNPPLQDIEVPSGKNDIQLRDGETILAEGLLTVPRNGSVSVVVHHPG